MRIFRVVKEVINYRFFNRTIRKASSESPVWSKLKLRKDWFNRVYTVINLPPSITNSPDFPNEGRPGYVMEELETVNKYLSEELQLQELITVRIEPIKEVNGDSFLVVYFYLFREITILWILRNILILTAFAFLIMNWNTVINYLSGLIGG